jgi:hypothetical protein
MRNFLNESCTENQNPQFVFSTLFSENLAVYEIMWKNMVESDRRMRFTCWITNATDTHSEYVIRFFSTETVAYSSVPVCYVVCTLLVSLFVNKTNINLVYRSAAL